MKKIIMLFLVGVLCLSSQAVFGQSMGTLENRDKLKLVSNLGESIEELIEICNLDVVMGNIETEAYYEEYSNEEVNGTEVRGYLSIDKHKFNYRAKGTLAVDNLNTGRLMSGALDGEIVIMNKKYDLLLGYVKKGEKTCLSFNISDEYVNLMLVYGEPPISKDDYTELKLKQKKETMFNAVESNNYSNNNMEIICGKKLYLTGLDKYLKKGITYYNAGGFNVYKLKDDDVIIICPFSKVSSISELLEGTVYEDLLISGVRGNVEMDKGTMSGMAPVKSKTGKNVKLINIFYDIANTFSIPTNTINEFVSSADIVGAVDIDANMNNPSIDIKIGTNSNDGLNFEYNNTPLFSLKIDGNNDNKGKGKVYVSLTYRMTAPYAGGQRTFLFLKTGEKYASFNIDTND